MILCWRDVRHKVLSQDGVMIQDDSMSQESLHEPIATGTVDQVDHIAVRNGKIEFMTNMRSGNETEVTIGMGNSVCCIIERRRSVAF